MKIKRALTVAAWCAALLTSLDTAASRAARHDKSESVGEERVVKGRALTSTRMPPVRITVGEAFRYAGSQRFVLYDSAQVEQYFFVEAGRGGAPRRVIIVQFEGYLPSNTHTYDYRIDKKVSLGGLEFMTDSSAGNPELVRQHRPDSDTDRAVRFLESKGHRPAGDFASQRFVHLADEARRNELLILYVESLAGTDLSPADFTGEAGGDARREGAQKGLLERALKSFTVTKQ